MHRPVHQRPAVPALFAALTLALAGCAGDATGPDEFVPIEELPRQLTASETAVITGSNAFAFDLLRQVHAAEDEPNVFLSPLSASMALGMALVGADGDAYDAMQSTLGLAGLTEEEVQTSYRDLIDLLVTLDPAVEFDIANSAWAKLGIPFHDAYFQTVQEYFDAEVQELDFEDPATIDVINAWVKEKTQGRIEKIVKQIKPTDALFLLNAIYFKGDWTEQFDPGETRTGSFTTVDGGTVDVDMMRGELEVGIGGADGVVIGELRYGGAAYVMDIVLPTGDGTVADLVTGLDAGTWAAWMEAVHYGDEDIHVRMPKFELAYGEDLSDALKAMGMEVAFDRSRQNFPRMTPMPRSWIDRVKQKTFLKVDEEGTTAAAVTSVVIGVDSAPPSLIVDRPFLVAIRERLSGTILFLGVIGDPTFEAS